MLVVVGLDAHIYYRKDHWWLAEGLLNSDFLFRSSSEDTRKKRHKCVKDRFATVWSSCDETHVDRYAHEKIDLLHTIAVVRAHIR